MPLSTLDPVTALIVVDLQKGLLDYDTVTPVAEIAARTGRLAAAFREAGRPVVLVNVTGGAPGRTETPGRAAGERPADYAEIIDSVGRQPDDHLVTKQTWGAFHGTDLHEYLQGRGVTQVVLTGVATCAGVESTARAAHEHGYHVVLAEDAMTDRDAAAHDHSVTRIFPRLGEVATSTEIIAMLPS